MWADCVRASKYKCVRSSRGEQEGTVEWSGRGNERERVGKHASAPCRRYGGSGLRDLCPVCSASPQQDCHPRCIGYASELQPRTCEGRRGRDRATFPLVGLDGRQGTGPFQPCPSTPLRLSPGRLFPLFFLYSYARHLRSSICIHMPHTKEESCCELTGLVRCSA